MQARRAHLHSVNLPPLEKTTTLAVSNILSTRATCFTGVSLFLRRHSVSQFRFPIQAQRAEGSRLSPGPVPHQ